MTPASRSVPAFIFLLASLALRGPFPTTDAGEIPVRGWTVELSVPPFVSDDESLSVPVVIRREPAATRPAVSEMWLRVTLETPADPEVSRSRVIESHRLPLDANRRLATNRLQVTVDRDWLNDPADRVVDLQVALVPGKPPPADAPKDAPTEAPDGEPWAETRLRLWRIGGTGPAGVSLDGIVPDADGFSCPVGRLTWRIPRRSEADGRRGLPWRLWREVWRRKARERVGQPAFLVVAHPADAALCLDPNFCEWTPAAGAEEIGTAPPVYRLVLNALRTAEATRGDPRDVLLFPGLDDVRHATSLEEYGLALQAACAAFDRGGAGWERGGLVLATPPPFLSAPSRQAAYRDQVVRVARERQWRVGDLTDAFASLPRPAATAPVSARWDEEQLAALRAAVRERTGPGWGSLALAALPLAGALAAWLAVGGLWYRARWRG